jgi:hypothetical protein
MASFFKRLIVIFMIPFSFQSDPAGQERFSRTNPPHLSMCNARAEPHGAEMPGFQRNGRGIRAPPAPFCGLSHNGWGTFPKASDIQILLVAGNAARARSRRVTQLQREGDDWQAAREFVQTLRHGVRRNFLTV